jgi:hypothetical protein
MLVAQSVMKQIGVVDDEMGNNLGKAMEIASNDLGFQLLNKVRADPSLIGKTITVSCAPTPASTSRARSSAPPRRRAASSTTTSSTGWTS